MKCAVLISGGVDSSVALKLLQVTGRYDLTAFYLKIWLEDELAYMGQCPWEEDLAYVRSVCETAGVPLEVVSLQREYWERVVAHTLAELKAGRTPSPDILCNERVKFGAFFERIGAEFALVASGHYAQTRQGADGRSELVRGVDPVKDQTYFLSHLRQDQIARVAFPIGGLKKTEVRALATTYSLPNRDRPDSQGICFLGKIPYNEFVRYHLGVKPGRIIDKQTGRILGGHQGTWFHTIGQRKGLGLSGGPWFVAGKDLSENVVYVVHESGVNEAAERAFVIAGLNWIAGFPARPDLSVKIRHGERTVACKVEPMGEGRMAVTMAEPDRGIAPGQYAVLYDGDVCLGGGVID